MDSSPSRKRVEIQKDISFGYSLVARKDYKPGDIIFTVHTKSYWKDDTKDKKDRFTRDHERRGNETNETKLCRFNGNERTRLRSSNFKGRTHRE